MKAIKPVKAWAVQGADGCVCVGWELYALYITRRSARKWRGSGGRVVRVEIRELPPTRKARTR